jgi:hypothetical protein
MNVAGFTALLDACVLYPAAQRDLLIETAKTEPGRLIFSLVFPQPQAIKEVFKA